MISPQAAHLAKVWQHPDVLPWVALGTPELVTAETAQKLLDSGAIYLSNEYGGFLIIPNPDNVCDVHTQFVPEGRGKELFHFADECIGYMFKKTPCVALRSFVPDDNKPARVLVRRCGFVEIGNAEVNGISGKIWLLTVKKWVVDLCRPQ